MPTARFLLYDEEFFSYSGCLLHLGVAPRRFPDMTDGGKEINQEYSPDVSCHIISAVSFYHNVTYFSHSTKIVSPPVPYVRKLKCFTAELNLSS
jgi:hypothetical protein